MRSEKTTARVVGILFIVATGFAVIGDRLLRPIRDADDYLVDLAGDESRVILGVLSEVTLALAVIAIAALLFPILKRQDEGMAANYVGVRVLEGAIIVVGGLSSLVLLSISQDHSGTETPDGTLEPLGAAFLAVREWTDVLGPTIVFAVSALILYRLLYQSETVPRWLSIWGFVGGLLLLVAGILGMWGESATSTTSIVLTAPIGLNEMVLAVWLILRGFDSPGQAAPMDSVRPPAESVP
jgi:membrane-bound metal-dependent hydrolase YbcI (DUF457 family)